MSWRISKIEIENLKFFHDIFTMDVDRKNVLLFGENGAGKSSIYWSVYTHFQAFFKSRPEAVKYFTAGHPENLRNRYSDSADHSGVAISFKDNNGSEITLRDSISENYNDSVEFRNFMRGTIITSDFLNYKQISKLFDFENSRENDVFSIFEKEVFPLLNLSAVLEDINGNNRNTSNLADWWNYIKRYNEYLPRNAKRKNTFLKGEEHKAYRKILRNFNSVFKLLMEMIISKANDILREDFNIPVELIYQFDDIDLEVISENRKITERLTPPRLLIHAKMIGDAIRDRSVVRHPKSFFNEAKITCMGIALRLAVLLQRSPVESAAAVVFVDDLLISLDMSMRMGIVPRILDLAERWQLFVFTHDRSLFHLYRSKINSRRELRNLENEQRAMEGLPVSRYFNWKIYELYSKTSENGIPKWILSEEPSYIDLAKIHLDALRIPECANALRRYCEMQMKRIVPYSLHHQHLSDWNSNDKKDLNAMLDSFKKFIVEGCRISSLANFLSDVDVERKLLFNPFSHDDVDTPFYRSELKKLIRDLPVLDEISINQIFRDDTLRNSVFKIALSKQREDETFEAEVKFKFLERFYKVNFRGHAYYSDPEVLVLDFDDNKITHIIKNRIFTLRKVYKRLHHYVAPGLDRYGLDIISEVAVDE